MYTIIRETDPIHVGSIIQVLFGEPGIGKTSLTFTAESPLLEDFDGGVHRAVNRKTAIKFDNWKDVIDFHKSGELQNMGIKTLIIDTAGTCLDGVMAQAVILENNTNSKTNGQLSLQGYGALKNTFQQFINWAKSEKIDVIFICHSEQFKDGDTVKYRPKMTGGSYDILISVADMVGYVQSINDKRTIDFNPTDQHIGKNTAEFPVIEIPHYTKKEYETFMGDLIKKTKDKMMSMSVSQQKALETIKTIRAEIEVCKTADEVNLIYPKLQDLSNIEKLQLEKLCDEQIKFIFSAAIEEGQKVTQFNAILKDIKKQRESLQKIIWKELWLKAKDTPNVEYNKEKKAFVNLKKEEPKKEEPVETPIEESSNFEEPVDDIQTVEATEEDRKPTARELFEQQ